MNEYQKKQEEILASRQKIIESLREASSALRKAREECRVTMFWNLGGTAKEIEALAEKIDMLAHEIPIPVPEQRGE